MPSVSIVFAPQQHDGQRIACAEKRGVIKLVSPICVERDTDKVAAAIIALAHHVRLDVWRLLLPHGSLGLSAGTIAAHLAIAPSSLSFHLLQMSRGRVLIQRRLSRQVIHAINEDVVALSFGFLTGEDMHCRCPAADL
jgi:ArsR family transcriptional regulator